MIELGVWHDRTTRTRITLQERLASVAATVPYWRRIERMSKTSVTAAADSRRPPNILNAVWGYSQITQ